METIRERVVHRTQRDPVEVIEPDGTVSSHRTYRKKKDVFRAYQVVWYIWGIIGVLLGFRFLLEILGANPYSGFADFIYSLSYPFVAPFRGVFGTGISGRFIFDWAAILAFLAYTVLAYIVAYFLQILYPVTPHELDTSVEV